jgi:hypothetical protein
MVKKYLLLILSFCTSYFSQGQTSVDSTVKGKWKLNGYGEMYFGLNRLTMRGQHPSDFQYNHIKTNQIAINQSSIGIDHEGRNIRAGIGLHTGTYVRSNYSNEKPLLQTIYKAHIGIRISKKKNAWLEAGVFPSYIGFEGVNAFYNTTLTRSLLAENSPYFLSGLKANYLLSPKNEIAVYILTGWQRITPQKGNSLPSRGLQWIHKPNDKSKVNWSSFIGSDNPDSTRKWRYFNNFFWQFEKGKWACTIGLDVGIEQKERKSKSFYTWYSPIIITQYTFNKKWQSAIRIERYLDPSRVITKPTNGLAVLANSQSINTDFHPAKGIICRAEWRIFQARQPVLRTENGYTKSASLLTLSTAVQLNTYLKKRPRLGP